MLRGGGIGDGALCVFPPGFVGRDGKPFLSIERAVYRLTGEVKYYFGLPVTNGQIRWRVTREPVRACRGGARMRIGWVIGAVVIVGLAIAGWFHRGSASLAGLVTTPQALGMLVMSITGGTSWKTWPNSTGAAIDCTTHQAMTTART